MMENRGCKSCKFGAVMDNHNIVWKFRTAYKKVKTIDYNNGEAGCRKDEWNVKEKNCLEKPVFPEWKKG